MHCSTFRGLSLTLLLILGALPAWAQMNLTPLSLETRSYDTLVSWQERAYRPAGLVEYVNVPGHVLLDVRAVFDGPWSDDVSRVSVNSRDINLILPDGTELRAVGAHRTWGQMSLQAQGLSGRRPRDFPEDDADLYWNGIFVLPKGTTSATLRIGGDVQFEATVSVPGPTAADDAASFADFDPVAVRRFRVLHLEDGRGENAVTSTIPAPQGMVLAEVEVAVTGVRSNQTDGDQRFTWHTHNFRLVDAQGQSMGLVGERFMRRVLDSQFSGTDIDESAERRMVWAVPETLTEARLLFGETEVATVALGSAPITDTD